MDFRFTRKLFFKKSLGTSLIEMLAILFVISLLTSIVLANYKFGQKSYVVLSAGQQLISDLRQAQSYALNYHVVPGVSVPIYGFGVWINSASEYYLFADVDDPNDPVNSSGVFGKYDVNSDSVIQRVKLSKGLQFDANYIGAGFVFRVPFGEVYNKLGQKISSFLDPNIVISGEGNNSYKIGINPTGLIYQMTN